MKKKYSIKSEVAQIATIYDGLKEDIQEHVSQKLLNKILLVTQEIVTDSVIHGNKSDPAKDVVCDLEVTEKEISITVTDEGTESYTIPTKEEAQDMDYLEESGRGLKLAVLLSDELIQKTSSIQLIFKRNEK